MSSEIMILCITSSYPIVGKRCQWSWEVRTKEFFVSIMSSSFWPTPSCLPCPPPHILPISPWSSPQQLTITPLQNTYMVSKIRGKIVGFLLYHLGCIVCADIEKVICWKRKNLTCIFNQMMHENDNLTTSFIFDAIIICEWNFEKDMWFLQN